MGYYLNPRGMSKEKWLEMNAIEVTAENRPTKSPTDAGDFVVCWVHNGAFTAVALCYCTEEIEAFLYPEDQRPKRWFLIPGNLAKEFGYNV